VKVRKLGVRKLENRAEDEETIEEKQTTAKEEQIQYLQGLDRDVGDLNGRVGRVVHDRQRASYRGDEEHCQRIEKDDAAAYKKRMHRVYFLSQGRR